MLRRMALQIFGTKKRPDTRKAERFFKDQGIGYQFITRGACPTPARPS
jgi:hypothetical protein